MRAIILTTLFSLLLVACASDRYPGNAQQVTWRQSESPTKKGVRYLLGRGGPQDDKKAFDQFLIAADHGNKAAQNQVAYMYAAGKGTTQNYGKAIIYYRKAANQGLVSAQYNLGLMYLYGMGTERNKQEALTWIQKAADKGFEPAKVTLSKETL